ncbi:MAG: chemotaxis protein CheD [Planctomycetes bacterium]|nr:chemotaxis protein CheD [Planctomycetota bacterium]
MTKGLIKVGMADAKISARPGGVLVTYALGSCIGVCLYDPEVSVGGMGHYLLPNSTNEASAVNPFKYVDSGMEKLLAGMLSKGAIKRRIKVSIAGGAKSVKISAEEYDIGKRNYLAIRKSLWKNGMLIDSEDVGGSFPRTMYMRINDGEVTIKSYSKKMARKDT